MPKLSTDLSGKTIKTWNKNFYKNTFVSFFTNPYKLISMITLMLLACLIIMPLWEILTTTFKWRQIDLREVKDAVPGEFTLYHWKNLLSSNISQSLFYKPMANTLLISITVSFFAISLGSIMAWLIVRTDLPCKKLFTFLIIMPYMLPSWYKAMAWLAVFKNDRIGGSQGLLNYIFNITTPDWLAYGFVPIVLILSIHYYAFTFLLMSSALSSVGGDLEEMAEIAGANRFTILKKITLPIVLPAILSSIILTFSKVIGTFGVPAFLGLKVNYYTISTMLYSSMRNRQTVQAYILSIFLILIAALTVYINQRAIGKRKSYTTIGGKGTRRNLFELGKMKNPVVIILSTFLVLAGIMPLILMILQTFMLKVGEFSLSNFTTHFWIGQSIPIIGEGEPGILKNPAIWSSIKNTFKLVISSSVIATFVGLILGYIISRGRKKLSGRIIDQLSFTPYLIPSIAFGAIYLSMFSQPRFIMPALYGTLALLILISVVKYLPFAARAGTSNMIQIGTELEEAAAIEGASFMKRFLRIMLPLSKQGFLSGFLLIFISAMKELDLIVLLATPSTTTLTALTYAYSDTGFRQYGDAMTTIIVITIIVVYLLSTKIGKADMSKGIGG